MRAVQRRKLVVLRTPFDTNGVAQGGNYQFVCLRAYTDFVIHLIVGNVAGDLVLTLEQAKNIGGGSKKALAFNKIYKVQTNAGSVEDQDKAIPEDVASTYTVANATMDQYHIMIEMRADQLDVNNAFDCIRPVLTDPAAAAVLVIMIECLNPRYSGQENENRIMPSAKDQT